MNKTSQYQAEIAELRENLEMLSRELHKTQWIELSATNNQQDFSLPDRKTIAQQAQIFFIKNPLIGLAVTLKTAFVFGKGISIKAEHDLIQEVIDDFWNDNDNKAELTGKQAQKLKANTAQLDGNIFLTFFINVSNGHVKASSIPVEEIEDVIMHPQNRRKPLWYKRVYQEQTFNYSSGTYDPGEIKIEYYRDWKNIDPADKQYDPPGDKIAKDAAGREILVYHTKVNCTDKQKFGFPETYRAHDWAKAYTEFLSDLASIWKTLAIFAAERKMKGATKGQIKATAAAARTYNQAGEKVNDKPAAGSTRYANENDEWSPIKTNGVTMKADDGRRLLLMVCAAMGIFEHYFGDGSNGNLASTESMELPMLKMFEDRQSLFEDMYREICELVIRESAKASSGKLHPYATWEDEVNQSGKLTLDGYTEPVKESKKGLFQKLKEAVTNNGQEEQDKKPPKQSKKNSSKISQTVSVDFPPITQKDVVKLITGLKTALTLDGNGVSQTPMLPPKKAARLVMTALDIDDIDEALTEIYPDDGEELGANNIGPNGESDYQQQLDSELQKIAQGSQPVKPQPTGVKI